MKKVQQHRTFADSLRIMPLAGISLTALLAASPALAAGALPTGGLVTAGQATIGAAANGLIIDQATGHAIINWQDFSRAGNTVKFNNGLRRHPQPRHGRQSFPARRRAAGHGLGLSDQSARHRRGSRWQGSDRRQLRRLHPRCDDGAFMQGDALHAQGTSNGNVVNQGKIASRYGDTILIGKSVNNSGVIKAPRGTAALAAGDDVTLRPLGGDARISVAAGSGDVTNTGTVAAAQAELNAAGGTFMPSQATRGHFRHRHNHGQRPYLAHQRRHDGSLRRSGRENADGSGGTAGGNVAIDAGANISVSGATGGTVLIGGDQAGGSDPARKLVSAPVATAQTTNVAAGAKISADGNHRQGWPVARVWSDNYTSYNGAISARGADDASGGSAEVSSHGVLDFEGTADLLSDTGATGTLLLDPFNVTISTGTNNLNPTGNQSPYLYADGHFDHQEHYAFDQLAHGRRDRHHRHYRIGGGGLHHRDGRLELDQHPLADPDGAFGHFDQRQCGTITAANGSLVLNPGASSTTSIGAAINVGSLTVNGTGAVTQTISGTITATNLALLGGANYTLTRNNSVTTLAASVGSFSFTNVKLAGHWHGGYGQRNYGQRRPHVERERGQRYRGVGNRRQLHPCEWHWSQNQASLPTFTAATNFTISGGIPARDGRRRQHRDALSDRGHLWVAGPCHRCGQPERRPGQ